MAIEKTLDDVLDTRSKVKIIRLFCSKTKDFMASGREIAKAVDFTPPAAHAALKQLYNQGILKQDIIGKQHIYRMNYGNRVVKEILLPAFGKERRIKEAIGDFLLRKIKERKIKGVLSLILYGSIQRNAATFKSDCDIAIVTKNEISKNKIESIFVEKIYDEFAQYFGINLDAYIKTANEFKMRIRKNLPPVSALMKSYNVIYGKDPLDYI